MNQPVPYCGLPPHPDEWVQHWNLDPLLIAALLASALFGIHYRRHLNGAMFFASVVVLTIVFVSPLCALASALFSARSVHHILIMSVAAPLLAYSIPARMPFSLTTATLAKCGFVAAWHIPAAYSLALASDSVYWLLQSGLLAASIAFWSALRFSPAPAAFAALAGIMTVMGIVGALLTFSPSALYAAHLGTTQSWGLTPLEDQQLSGLIMWAVTLPVYVLAASAIAGRLVSRPRSTLTI